MELDERFCTVAKKIDQVCETLACIPDFNNELQAWCLWDIAQELRQAAKLLDQITEGDTDTFCAVSCEHNGGFDGCKHAEKGILTGLQCQFHEVRKIRAGVLRSEEASRHEWRKVELQPLSGILRLVT